MERRLSKKDLMELYGVDRVTIEDWRRYRGLKMIEVSTHSKYITEKDYSTTLSVFQKWGFL